MHAPYDKGGDERWGTANSKKTEGKKRQLEKWKELEESCNMIVLSNYLIAGYFLTSFFIFHCELSTPS